jgi:ribonuclease D
MINTPKTSEMRYVDTPQALTQLCQDLRSAKVIAVDTEFIREKTYYAKLCLIQVASDAVIACIDPLALNNLDELLEILYSTDKLKLFHAAWQDLEIFYDQWGRIPGPIFDTQIAAALLGFSDQIGYANLVEQLLHTELDKSAVRTDWAQRPLSAQQLAYAADDVHYLLKLYPLILQRLTDLGRNDWLEEDFMALTDPATYAKSTATAWQRISGHGRLKPRQLAVLQGLAAWREQQARQRNKPRKWILSDDLLLTLVRQLPTDQAKLAQVRGLTPNQLNQYGEGLIAAINTALALPEDAWPGVSQKERLSPEQECLADTLMAYLRLLAQQNQISPASLGTRKDIEKLVRGKRDIPLLHGWRGHLAGIPLQQLIDGNIALTVKADHVVAIPTDNT